MSVRVVFDESHGEQVSNFNCRGISYILEKLKIISFRLISGPITVDKIINEDILFLGAPTEKFLDFEINTLEYFVSKGKYLIIICPMPIPINFTLNDLTIKFGIKFNHNVVQDKKHNLNGAMYFPIIRQFQRDLFTNGVKELIYSGCSLKQFTPGVKILAKADEHAEPPSAPVIMTSKSGRVICIGGYTLFQDDKRYGIKAKNNIRFVANIFRTIIQQRDQKPKEPTPAKMRKPKSIDPKKAKKHFEQLTNDTLNVLKKLLNEIDKLFDEILKLIESQKFSLAEETLQLRYSKLKNTIEGNYRALMEELDYITDRIKANIDFPAVVKEFSDQVLVMESDALSKLDMIRFNLSNRIKNEKLRSQHR
ncbi:MAG: hypothetical protein HWN66_09260 [Candidatus Helarchaeota archaeon]|nr:hypothetical protein [Candidatus Helarchaeota archaeon]